MKRFLLLISFWTISISVSAQNSASDAKAAYLLAEEEFEAGKYTGCIAYLQEAEKNLGKANAKILYLKVLALQQLAAKDYGMLAQLLEAIQAFEKAPGIQDFNEEKRLEITKLKLKLANRAVAAPGNKLELLALKQMRISGWQLGMTLEEMKYVYADFFNQQAPYVIGSKIQYSGVYKNMSGLRLTLESGRLVQIDCFFVNTTDDSDFSKGKRDWEGYYQGLLSYLGNSVSDTLGTANAKVAGKVHERVATRKDGTVQVGFHLEGMKQDKTNYNSYAYLSVASVNQTN